MIHQENEQKKRRKSNVEDNHECFILRIKKINSTPSKNYSPSFIDISQKNKTRISAKSTICLSFVIE
jgi:hypothetical protein